jgi:hypothetical protein
MLQRRPDEGSRNGIVKEVEKRENIRFRTVTGNLEGNVAQALKPLLAPPHRPSDLMFGVGIHEGEFLFGLACPYRRAAYPR